MSNIDVDSSKYEALLKEYEGIKLNLDWFYLNPLKFQQVTNYIHEDNCGMYNEKGWNEDNCTCNPKGIEVVVGRLNVFRQNGPEDDKRYFTVCIPSSLEEYLEIAEKPEDAHLLWEHVELYPKFLKEDIQNGLTTLYHCLKYYEVTGKELDFFSIDVKELEDILYDKC